MEKFSSYSRSRQRIHFNFRSYSNSVNENITAAAHLQF